VFSFFFLLPKPKPKVGGKMVPGLVSFCYFAVLPMRFLWETVHLPLGITIAALDLLSQKWTQVVL
jgi:hypothetical protein